MITDQTDRLGPGLEVVLLRHGRHLPNQEGAHQTRDASVGANPSNLIEGQLTYAAIGACGERVLPHVRPPGPAETLEPDWRPISSEDNFEAIGDRTAEWPDDRTVLYWWRPTFWRSGEGG